MRRRRCELPTSGRPLAVLDDASHALPHEQPGLLRALVTEWLARVERSDRADR